MESKIKTGRLTTNKMYKKHDEGIFDSDFYDMKDVTIPRQIKISSRFEDNSIECVRRRLRSNLINHTKYNPSFQGEMGVRYFKGVYQPNNPMHVNENALG